MGVMDVGRDLQRAVGEAQRGADLAPPVDAARGRALRGVLQLGDEHVLGDRCHRLGVEHLHRLALVPAQEDRVIADRRAREVALDDLVADVLGGEDERRCCPPPAPRRPRRRARRPTTRSPTRDRCSSVGAGSARTPWPAAGSRRTARARSDRALGPARGARRSAGSPRAGPARRRGRPRHPRRIVSSINPGRICASFGPSLSPRFMYICRMRSEVVTDAWRSMTAISPTISPSWAARRRCRSGRR